MNCPVCKGTQVSCIDSRPHPDSIRRRRECAACGFRFTTIEMSVDRLADIKDRGEMLQRLAGMVQNILK